MGLENCQYSEYSLIKQTKINASMEDRAISPKSNLINALILGSNQNQYYTDELFGH